MVIYSPIWVVLAIESEQKSVSVTNTKYNKAQHYSLYTTKVHITTQYNSHAH